VPELRAAHDRWHIASLPELAGIKRAFDIVLLCAVWYHLSPAERAAAWPRVAGLCKGLVLLSLRHGPAPAERPAFEACPDGEARLAAQHGLKEIARHRHGSLQAQNHAAGVTWTWLALEQIM